MGKLFHQWIRLLIHGDRRKRPRDPQASEVIVRQRRISQRLRKLEMELELRRRD